MCNLITKAISFFAYFGYIQRNFVQAAYWHDPFNEKDYRKYNIFLADINQENKFNLEYKLNMIKLKSFVMVKFANDHMIQPVESQWFGFYKENDIGNLYTMEESPLYMNVRIFLNIDYNDWYFIFLFKKGHVRLENSPFIRQIAQADCTGSSHAIEFELAYRTYYFAIFKGFR